MYAFIRFMDLGYYDLISLLKNATGFKMMSKKDSLFKLCNLKDGMSICRYGHEVVKLHRVI